MRYIVSPECQAKWKHIELNTDQSQPQTRLSEYDYPKGGNNIVEETLIIWKEIAKKYKLEGDSKLLMWPSQASKFGPG